MEDFTPKLSAELFISRLRGGSQPILAQASDGHLYVLKFQDSPQGENLPFNEALGSALFEACGLNVPEWAAIEVSESFLERFPESWFWTGSEYRRPKAGFCFGSRYLSSEETPVLEILSSSSFSRIRNRSCFWTAWFIDILSEHCDHRQSLFVRAETGELVPYFIDHGHLFGGPSGALSPKLLASRFLDSRIYQELSLDDCNRIVRIIESLHQDKLLRVIASLPQSWVTPTAIDQFHQLQLRLTDGSLIANISDYLCNSYSQIPGVSSESRKTARGERFPGAILPAGLSTVRYA